ncbi:MAG: lipocalin-like domain-containing protein [Chloroflexi bacterium]|nr:lipocalin-like domain-containing protein [Chloroflexota bacterium]
MSNAAERSSNLPLTAGDLVGAWRLQRWDTAFDDGSVGFVMGAEPVGLIVYTIEGTIITTISAADRPAIDGNDVVHEVAISLFPNWVGGTQRRHVSLSDDGRVLTLSTDPLVAGGRRGVQPLVWERIATG